MLEDPWVPSSYSHGCPRSGQTQRCICFGRLGQRRQVRCYKQDETSVIDHAGVQGRKSSAPDHRICRKTYSVEHYLHSVDWPDVSSVLDFKAFECLQPSRCHMTRSWDVACESKSIGVKTRNTVKHLGKHPIIPAIESNLLGKTGRISRFHRNQTTRAGEFRCA